MPPYIGCMKRHFEMVIHSTYGGFFLTNPMVKMLRDMDSELMKDLGPECQASFGQWYHPHQGDEEFRAHPDLIEVVKLLTDQLDSLPEDAPWEERAKLEQKLLHGLKVTRVEVDFDIVEDDGKETIEARGRGY